MAFDAASSLQFTASAQVNTFLKEPRPSRTPVFSVGFWTVPTRDGLSPFLLQRLKRPSISFAAVEVAAFVDRAKQANAEGQA
jgi:hypothetical protein